MARTLWKLALLGALPGLSSAALSTVVGDSCNQYAGTANATTGVTRWLGIRYAAPPVGSLRFMPPQDALCQNGVQNATQHGPICIGTGESESATRSEDCLFLDIYAPSNATSSSKLPVVMFIQGGGFNKNSNSNYDGTGLVKAGDYGLIAITFNYRVGPYGFLTNGNEVEPNNGLKDQRKALQWIKKNIAQFGGDPDHVVLIGGSAGGASISLQLIAYGGKDEGLFHGAAATAVSFATVLTVEESQYQYDNFAILAGCAVADSLACLRSKNTTELQAANKPSAYPGASEAPLYMWNPVVDGDMLTELTYTAFEEGRFLRVPVIFGTSTNDGRSFAPRGTSTLGQSNTFLKDQFPYMTIEQMGKINDMYPNENNTCPDTGCYFGQAAAAYGDVRYMCPGMWISSIYEKFGQGSKSWNYRYDVEDPKQVASGEGVPHTSENQAIFGPEYTNGGAPASLYPGQINAHAVDVTQGYWTSFIRTLDPNTHKVADAVNWDTWTDAGHKRLLIATGGKSSMEVVDDKTRERCEYITSIGVAIKQ
ncbi:hypothetical protein MCOR27_004543 [Pyricularia oryzae]|uniref:Carboxylic ester hydrolase n=1 Tax=Pyricularia grisea TaxID=148305 RepID=A0ABQ8NQN7_PYRGI|nr:hypothetical protein MCOR01_002843 [Pyricularia oryzae]KAI6299795.1 hypothetical protein MCOR33_004384 [Pyricularia grisea]KAI6280761.1 hypothetical protein MCOR27_004543 [Pyricularia oryzae]KAI6330837.1 hypothetical protein MCOR29_001778 [Pyricularia oryzae]KAI6366861.1 hypothetical protein MCOR31_006283 [Pyricularia oryzae]